MNTTIHNRLYVLLIATLAYLIFLHLGHLPIWVTVLSVVFGLWRLLVAFNKAKPAKLIVLAPLTVIVGIGILLTYKGLIYRDSGVSLLLIMMMLKLLEAKNKHDYILITLLGYLLTGALFLFSQTITTFLLSIPAIVLLTTALIQLNRQSQQKTEIQSVKTASKMLMQSVPLMLVLFLLFPRISQPLWGGSVSPSLINTTGLSESIELNQISQAVKNNGSVAFRVKFNGKIPDQSELYWRGPVLWYTDGQRWEIASNHRRLPYEQLTTQGSPFEYTMTMEPNYHKWLVLLDMPNKTPESATFSPDRTVIAAEPTVGRIRYEAASWARYQLDAGSLSKSAREMALQLTDANPKTIALGQQWATLTPQQTVQAALYHFQTENFIYTLNPPKAGKDPIDDFMFLNKRGFCEHYATSFVYLMRAAGIPARVVTGYQGGEINNDYLIVRQSNAHAWAEVWFEEEGWVRIDPTHAVAPDRVEQDISTAIKNSINQTDNETSDENLAEQSPDIEAAQLPIQERIKQYPLLHQSLLKWDSIENGWNQWVIDYNQKKQKNLLSKLTGKPIELTTIAILFIMGLLFTGLMMVVIFVMKHKPQIDKTQKLYAQFIKKLKPHKLKPYPYETATDFAKRASGYLPHQQKELEQIAAVYNKLSYSRYSKIADNSLFTTFANMVHQFKPTNVK